MRDEAGRRQEDTRYKCFFRKIADRLKGQGFDNPADSHNYHFILEDKKNIESELGELIWERERNGESHIWFRLLAGCILCGRRHAKPYKQTEPIRTSARAPIPTNRSMTSFIGRISPLYSMYRYGCTHRARPRKSA